jgi:hypothetical protein
MTYMNTATCVHYHMASTHGSSAEHMYVKKDDMSEEAARARTAQAVLPGVHVSNLASLKHVDRFSLKQLNSPASAECRNASMSCLRLRSTYMWAKEKTSAGSAGERRRLVC